MNYRVWVPFLILGLFLGQAGAVFSGDQVTRLNMIGEDAQVSLAGNSTIGEWTCEGDTVQGYVEVDRAPEELAASLDRLVEASDEHDLEQWFDRHGLGLPRVYVSIPVRQFDCGDSRQNRDMYEALRSEEHKNILYQFYGLEELPQADDLAGRSYGLRTRGGLFIGGAARTTRFPVEIQREDDLRFRVSGQIDTQMTRFNIQPPRALLGLIKAHDRLTVTFEVTVEHAGEEAEQVQQTAPEPPEELEEETMEQ